MAGREWSGFMEGRERSGFKEGKETSGCSEDLYLLNTFDFYFLYQIQLCFIFWKAIHKVCM